MRKTEYEHYCMESPLAPETKTMSNRLFVNTDRQEIADYVKHVVCLAVAEKNCECEACKRLSNSNNPDVLVIDVNNRDETAVAAFRKTMEQFYATAKNISRQKCLVIPDLEKLSVASQNAMLKFIEDNNDKAVVVASCSNVNKVIPTVKSRMTIHVQRTLVAFDEFEKWCFSHCIGETALYYALTQGDVSKVCACGKSMDVWKALMRMLPDKSKMRDIFKVLHLVKEKDKEAFCEKNPEMINPLFNLMQQIFFSCVELNQGETPGIPIQDCNWTVEELLDNIMLLDDEKFKTTKTYKAKDLTAFLIKLYKVKL